MSQFFLQILNMSISASYIILAVLLLRLLLKKAPKWIPLALWGIVAVRLLCPIQPESVFSLIPHAQPISPDIMTDQTPAINTGLTTLNTVVNPFIGKAFTPAPGDSANPLQIWIPIAAAVWAVGMATMLIYMAVSYQKLKKTVSTAVLLQDNIYQSETVAFPFVLGLIKPRIYLPFDMSEQSMAHVVAHEDCHIRCRDHLWKPLGFLLLTLHWFNPLMWLGYILFCRDIELACDEKVIRDLSREERADYSHTLLSCSIKRHSITACPLAFGEVGVKYRVKSVLNYKKPALGIILVALILCAAVAVCFLTDPLTNYGETDPSKLNDAQLALMEEYPQYFGLDAVDGLDIYVWQMGSGSYSFGLLPHSAIARGWLNAELLNLRSVQADDMRTILSTYHIDRDAMYIIPWQNPLSSYIGSYWIIEEGVDQATIQQAYIDNIYNMLFEPES